MAGFDNVNDQGHELDWDDEITKDSTEFSLLQPGKYPFKVKTWNRGQYNGGAKLPACKMCELEIIVWDPQTGDETLIKHRLYLHSKTEGLLSQFFVSIGLKKHGETLKMQWNKVTGATGICKVYIDEYTGNDSEKHKANKIKSFCDPEKADNTTMASQAPTAPAQPQANGFGGFESWN
jgi:hypothetical protein